MKLAKETLSLVLALQEEERQKLEVIIKTHVKACQKHGSPLESLDRVVIEGIQLIQLEAQHPTPVVVEMGPINNWPATQYEQYRSPREL